MENTDFENGICSNCGYELNSSWHPSYMKPGTQLHNRYIIGILIGINGEGANYIAYDKDVSRKVLIREFMPRNLCTRLKGKSLIGVSYNHLAEYKALMAEFTELNKTLARHRNLVHINSILDMFAENNTTYVVSEYVEGITLTDYLKDNAGEISWDKAVLIFPQLFDTISHIHSAGIIHRGLCPDTIYITNNNEFRISGFSISAIRTKGAELEPEIFDGYAAPEQYSVSNRQGTWTDVYAICAILYRVLTGCKPIDALSRMDKDNLSSPSELNENVPKYVSATIMRGMNLVGSDRIQSIDELKTHLFEMNSSFINDEDDFESSYDDEVSYDDNESEYVPGYSDDYSYDDGNDIENDYSDNSKKSSAAERIKTPIIIAVVLLVILLIGVFGLFKMLDKGNNTPGDTKQTEKTTESVSQTSEKTTESQTASVPEGDSYMPDLIGSDFDSSSSYYSEWFTLEPEYDYSDDYSENQIFWQEVEKDQLFKSGSAIKVKVSKGSRYIELPSYDGIGYYTYKTMLDELNIPTEYYGKTDTGYADGTVIGLSVADGEKYDRESGEAVTIYYAYTPETTETETETVFETELITEAQTDTVQEENQTEEYIDIETGTIIE